MKAIPIIAILCILSGCSSVNISPRTIGAVEGRLPDKDRAQLRLREAVAVANEFLASDFRKTLPSGTLGLDETGMVFCTAKDNVPIQIKCSFAGDILVPFHMVAQERSRGRSENLRHSNLCSS